jgi:uncharacterized protein
MDEHARQLEVIAATAAHVRGLLAGDSSGHDWWHVHRVWQTARHLAQREGADWYVVELAALLHDVADWKFHGGDETLGPRTAAAWLEGQGVDTPTIEHVREIIGQLSFKGAGVATPMRTLEGQVVQDADRLDAIGAIGIARAFAYGGHAGRAMYDPEIPPERHDSFEAYKRNSGPTINHFHEKLMLLKDRMNTSAGRALAEGRNAFMLEFLARFHAEWNGER